MDEKFVAGRKYVHKLSDREVRCVSYEYGTAYLEREDGSIFTTDDTTRGFYDER